MRELIKYELKKILCRRVNRIAMALGLILILFSNLTLIHDNAFLVDGTEYCTGREAFQKQAQSENPLTTELSEEFLTGFLRNYQQQLQGREGESESYSWSLIAPFSNLYSLIANHYREWNEHFEWEDLRDISTDGPGLGFYERRLEKIDVLLESDYSYGNYTEGEKAFWRQKATEVHTPFSWGSKDVWDRIWDSICLLIWLLFVVSICTASVFSGEYQERTDSLLLCTRHGKGKLIPAKLTAAFLFTFIYTGICAILSIGINVILLGTWGWHLPVQLFNTIIPYNWTVGRACLVNLLVIFLIFTLLTGISLFLSSLCKNPVAVLALDILLFYGTLFIPSSKTSWLWNHIFCLLPLHCFNLKDLLKMYISYPVGDKVISYLGMVILSYTLLSLLCILSTGRFFRKHQVGG